MTTAKMNRTSGLAETEVLRQLIDEAASILTEEGAREVYLFGSAASGRVREDSDIDLAVSGFAAGEIWHRRLLEKGYEPS